MANQQQDNQKVQNAANQRAQELKTNRQSTGAGETSKSTNSKDSDVEGRIGSTDRDVETFGENNREEQKN